MNELEEIIELIDKYWRFDDYQQPMSSWHEKQDLIELLRSKKQKGKTIQERKMDFIKKMSNYNVSYDVQMLKDFFNYWTEHGEKDKKMRFEKETSFDIGKRLERWSRNSKPKKVTSAAQNLFDKYQNEV